MSGVFYGNREDPITSLEQIYMETQMQYLEVRTEDYIGCVQCGKKIQIRDSFMQYNPDDRGRTRIFFCKTCNERYRSAIHQGKEPFKES